MQGAMVRALERRGPPPDSLRAWLSTVVGNLAIDRVRRARRELDAASLEHRAPSGERGDRGRSPEQEQLRLEALRRAIRALLEGSGEPDAAIVLRREVFDVDYRRIAESCGRTEPACRQAVRRALARARDRERQRADVGRSGRPTRAVADAALERFARSVLAGDPATLFDALRIDARNRARVDGLRARGPSCRTRVAFGDAGVRIELVLGDVVLCRLNPAREPRRAPTAGPVGATP